MLPPSAPPANGSKRTTLEESECKEKPTSHFPHHHPSTSTSPMNEIETFYGVVETTADALRIFQLCSQGILGRVRRRLHEKERHLIRSGSVFVFDEQESGIRRWTDGRLWSPSRILGNFLIYRELHHRKSPSSSVSLEEATTAGGEAGRKRTISYPIGGGGGGGGGGGSGESTMTAAAASKKKFAFKDQGLIKKTISISIQGHTHHLICYYSKRDHAEGLLTGANGQAWRDWQAALEEVQIPADLLANQSFRKAGADEIYKRSSLLEDDEEGEGEGEENSSISNSKVVVAQQKVNFTQPIGGATAAPSFTRPASFTRTGHAPRGFLHSFSHSSTEPGIIHLSTPPLQPAHADLFWGNGELESEFGHIAATLSKLAPASTCTNRVNDNSGLPRLPPITGESYSGDLPPLFLLPSHVGGITESNVVQQRPLMGERPVVEELLEQEYYRGLELFKAPISESVLGEPESVATAEGMLRLPLFPSVGANEATAAEYEERLKDVLFGPEGQ